MQLKRGQDHCYLFVLVPTPQSSFCPTSTRGQTEWDGIGWLQQGFWSRRGLPKRSLNSWERLQTLGHPTFLLSGVGEERALFHCARDQSKDLEGLNCFTF